MHEIDVKHLPRQWAHNTGGIGTWILYQIT